MPVELPLPSQLKTAKWKVKIREKERLEPPHVSIINGTDTWRFGLRSRAFLDKTPDPDEVPKELLELITLGRISETETVWDWLCEKWDEKYPENKVSSDD